MLFLENTNKRLSVKTLLLGFQHLFAMFGATVLVPALTGLNPAVALVTAGLGTLVFHFVTGRKVPVFVGSSFAFIGGIQILLGSATDASMADKSMIPSVQGAVIAAGLVYVVLSVIIYFIGAEKIKSLFPPVVIGPVIVVIGLTLSPTAISMASQNWGIAVITLVIVIMFSIFAKGIFRLVPVLLGIAGGYIASVLHDVIFTGADKLVNFQPVIDAPWVSKFWDFSGEFFTLPRFDMSAIILLAPIALVTFMEHIGDITTNGSVVGKDFLKDPGLHRTLLGDGLATITAGLLGGPPNTTYGENTGVLAVTKVYDPFILRVAACMAIVLGLFGKFAAILQTIPSPVMGGVSILLFGMIASVGMRTISEADFNFGHSRNLIIVALILVVGIGLSSGIEIFGVHFSGLFIAVVTGAVLNKILPQNV